LNELDKFKDLWTIEKNNYFIEILDDEYIIMTKNNMMLLIEDDDIYIKLVRAMLENNVKVVKHDSQTGDEIIISSYEALRDFDSIPRKDVNVKILWETDMSITKQLLNLKKICEQLSQVPTAQLFKMINKEDKEWVFAKMGYKQAMKLLDKAQAEGVKLEIEVQQ